MNFCVSLLDAAASKVRRIILEGGIDERVVVHFNKTILLSVPANKIAPGRLSLDVLR
jgi:hypothetical protein